MTRFVVQVAGFLAALVGTVVFYWLVIGQLGPLAAADPGSAAVWFRLAIAIGLLGAGALTVIVHDHRRTP